jgi:hypothetical protein
MPHLLMYPNNEPTEKTKAIIKKGTVPTSLAKNKNKLAQKDTDTSMIQ